MAILINCAGDLTLSVLRRVAWEYEPIEFTPQLLDRIAKQRHRFIQYVSRNPDELIYGVTTAHHIGAKRLMSESERADYSRRLPPVPPAIGKRLPERVVRAIIVARLTDFIVGTAPVKVETFVHIVQMLNKQMPCVSALGNGEPGDIIALGRLFGEVQHELQLELGEGMFIVNGSPCGAASMADTTLIGQGILVMCEEVFALAAAAMQARDDHYDESLSLIWGDVYQEQVLTRFRFLLDGRANSRVIHQAPVSFRSVPRVLGWLGRVQQMAEECSDISLTHPSNNPAFIASAEEAKVVSNGGYHNPMSAGVIDSLARGWADLAQLAMHQVNRLTEKIDGIMAHEAEPRFTLLYMAAAGWAEEARASCSASLIGLGGGGQTDTTTADLLAWNKSQRVAAALRNILAILAVLAAHTISRRKELPPPQLEDLNNDLLDLYPWDGPPCSNTDYLEQATKYLEKRAFGMNVQSSEHCSI